ncbi:MAG: F0F1 ATP synthase subunit A [Rubrivivax sp. SCN 71-131]|jgi:F-type H+-transporting ATPase subunit a|nr:MAG: F0F1 ATP synthase subunit A [Rubrivivax sp. SCN 71-131]
MQLTPDDSIVLDLGVLRLNATIVNTWIVMALLVAVSWLATRNLRADAAPGRWRNALEVLVKLIESQIQALAQHAVHRVMIFAGTLFLFIATSNLLAIVPGFRAPTGSLSTTVALTLAVLLAVPAFGVAHGGLRQYLAKFAQPSLLLLPLNLLGEVSRAISLAIRLYGNVMSGAVIAAILLGIAPFFFPAIMNLFSLLVGVIQGYIFATLAAVYIAAAMADPSPADDPDAIP